MGNMLDELGVGRSEFEEAYSDTPSQDLERLGPEGVEQTLEALNPAKPVCVGPDDTVADVIAGMAERNQGCVLVTVDEVLVGIFTERDVVRRVIGKHDPAKTKIREVMTESPEAVKFHDSVAVALNKMAMGGFRHVPLVDNQLHAIGVISMRDIVRMLVEYFPKQVLNVAPDPVVRNAEGRGGAG